MMQEKREAIASLHQRFNALKAESDAVYRAWRVAVGEGDLHRQVQLMGRERSLLREASAVMDMVEQLVR